MMRIAWFCAVFMAMVGGCMFVKPTPPKSVSYPPVDTPSGKVVCDTVYVPIVEYDTIYVGRNDSMMRRLNSANLKLARVKFYLDICNRKPSQDKFLKGWLNRVFKK